MAQSMKLNQTLLATLSQTSRYYNARPTLLASCRIRNYHGATASRPTSTGFSVTFADGPLESIIAQPNKVTAELIKNPEASAKKAPKKLRPRRTKDATIIRHGLEKSHRNKSAKDLSPKPWNASIENGKRGKDAAGSLAQNDNSEYDSREVLEKAPQPEEPVLQRDYPDTRTIHDAGRPFRSPKAEQTPKPGTEPPAKPPRPLSTYKERWQVQKAALKNKFGEEGWNPRKKLSPDTIEGIRALHAQYPDRYTTPVLAEQFAVSSEVIRRILKSKWSSNLDPEKAAERKERWSKRHDRIWDVKSAIGLRPKRKGAKGLEDSDQFEEELRGRELLEAYRNA